MVRYYGRARQITGTVFTNQPGLKQAGCPGTVGKMGTIVRFLGRRVNCNLKTCGLPMSGLRCKYGVRQAIGSMDWKQADHSNNPAIKDYCHQVVNKWNGVHCRWPQPKNRQLAGGVGNIWTPRRNHCEKTCSLGWEEKYMNEHPGGLIGTPPVSFGGTWKIPQGTNVTVMVFYLPLLFPFEGTGTPVVSFSLNTIPIGNFPFNKETVPSPIASVLEMLVCRIILAEGDGSPNQVGFQAGYGTFSTSGSNLKFTFDEKIPLVTNYPCSKKESYPCGDDGLPNIRSITSWGQWRSSASIFDTACAGTTAPFCGGDFAFSSNLVSLPDERLDLSGNCAWMFLACTSLQSLPDGGTAPWDVSQVTNMMGMFSGCTSFTDPGGRSLGAWNVAQVTNMAQMFYGATKFNGVLANWQPIVLTDASGMFHGAKSYNDGGASLEGGCRRWPIGFNAPTRPLLPPITTHMFGQVVGDAPAAWSTWSSACSGSVCPSTTGPSPTPTIDGCWNGGSPLVGFYGTPQLPAVCNFFNQGNTPA